MNNHRILELASRGDDRISIVGDVEFTGILRSPSTYIRTSPNAVVIRLKTYNQTTATDSNELSDQGPCIENGGQHSCRNANSHSISSSSSTSSMSPLRLKGSQATRPPPNLQFDVEHRRNRSGSAPDTSQCKHNQNGCPDSSSSSGTGPAGRGRPAAPPVEGTSIYNISLDSQRSQPGTRTHPMFLSHLEPASNPTNTVTNVTDSNHRQLNAKLETDRDTHASRTSAMHVGLAVGLPFGVMLFLFVVAYAVYKYRSRDEGTYRIDEGSGYDAYNSKPLIHLNGRAKYSRQKVKDNKEWYV